MRMWLGQKGESRVETFGVGDEVEKGEKLQLVVDGGYYKAMFLFGI